MQKRINYSLFIVQGRGLHQTAELDNLEVVLRHGTRKAVSHHSTEWKLVLGV